MSRAKRSAPAAEPVRLARDLTAADLARFGIFREIARPGGWAGPNWYRKNGTLESVRVILGGVLVEEEGEDAVEVYAFEGPGTLDGRPDHRILSWQARFTGCDPCRDRNERAPRGRRPVTVIGRMAVATILFPGA